MDNSIDKKETPKIDSNEIIQNVIHCYGVDEDGDVITDDECPNCGSEAIGFNGDNQECFNCGNGW